MKKIGLFLTCGILSISMFGQGTAPAQMDEATLNSEPVVKLDKGDGILKDVNMIANFRFASNNNFENGKFQNSAFQANELRMEIAGKVTDKISFRLRDRYAGNPSDTQTNDRLRYAVDLAYVDYAVTPRLTISGGKMLSEWGSYELDMNPVFMYTYNGLVNTGDFFLSGVKVGYSVTPEHRFTLQVVNSNSRPFSQNFSNTQGVEAAKAPLGATVNWRGNFADGMFSTMWSYSHYNLAKNKHWQLIALGNQLKLPNLTLQYDFKYSFDDIDNLGTVSNLMNMGFAQKALDARYMEHWVRAEYFFSPRWSFTGMGMVNSSYWNGNPDNSAARANHLRDEWSFATFLEYHLFKPYNVKLFGGYVGRYSKFTNYAKDHFGLENGNTGQIMIGIVSPLVLF